MAAQAQRIADLEARVADLADQLKLVQDAFVTWTLEDTIGREMTRAFRRLQQRPHLHAVPDPEPELEAGA